MHRSYLSRVFKLSLQEPDLFKIYSSCIVFFFFLLLFLLFLCLLMVSSQKREPLNDKQLPNSCLPFGNVFLQHPWMHSSPGSLCFKDISHRQASGHLHFHLLHSFTSAGSGYLPVTAVAKRVITRVSCWFIFSNLWIFLLFHSCTAYRPSPGGQGMNSKS